MRATGPDVIVGAEPITVRVCVTAVAELKLELPAWLEVIVVEPAPTIVTVLPLTVATDVSELV